MFVLNILCHNLLGTNRTSRGLGTKLAECGYETSKPGYESSGYERTMGTKRLVTAMVTYLDAYMAFSHDEVYTTS